MGALADEKGQNEGMKDCARAWHWPLKMFPHARALPFLPYSFYTRNPDGTTEQRSPPFSTLPPQRRSGRLIAVREREPAAAAPGEERERPDRAGTDGRTDGQTDRVDSGQTAAVRPLPGEPPLPFPVTEMELINPVYSGNILQRRRDGRGRRPQVNGEEQEAQFYLDNQQASRHEKDRDTKGAQKVTDLRSLSA